MRPPGRMPKAERNTMPTIKITDAAAEPITLAEAKAHLREDLADAGNDAYITGLITVVRQAAEERLQRTLLTSTWQRSDAGFTRGCIPLLFPRIQSITWLKYVAEDGTLTTLDPAAYELEATHEPGLLLPAYGLAWPAARARPGAVKVQYKAGYGDTADSLPKPIVQWMLLALTDLYENRARSSERPVLPQDFADGLINSFEIRSI